MTADKSTLSSLVASSSLVLLGTVLTSFGTFAERIVVARYFSLEAYGEVSIGLAIMSITAGISMAGLNHGVPRYVSRFDADADVRGVWLSGVLLAVGIAVAVTALLFANVESAAALFYDGTEASWLLRLFVLAIPLNVGFRMGLGTIRGFENTRYKVLVGDLLYPLLRIGLLVGLILGGVGLAAAGYAYVFAAAVALVAVYLLVNRIVPLLGPVNLHLRTLLTFSAPLVLSSILAVLLTRTDLLMIGYFSTSSEAGLYSAAFSMATTLFLVVGSLGYLYLPLTSRLDADGDHEEIADLYQVTTKWGFVVSFPLFVVFVAFAGDVLAMSFGPAYRAAGLAFVVLCVGFFSDAAFGRNRPTLKGLGATRRILWANVVALGANLALNVVLIPIFGILGAAVASAASYFGRNCVMYATLHRQYGITPFSGSVVRTYVVLPVVLLPAAVLVGRFVSLSLLLAPVALGVAGLATLATVLLGGCVDPDDAVVIEALEDATGVRVPFVRRLVPTAG